jgi:hypothetical protein
MSSLFSNVSKRKTFFRSYASHYNYNRYDFNNLAEYAGALIAVGGPPRFSES